MFTSASKTDTGKIRQDNQDTIFASDIPIGPLSALYIVADGMGGHNGGKVASEEAIREFVSSCEEADFNQGPQEFLFSLLQKANDHVYRLSLQNDSLKGMGSTFVLAAVVGDCLYVLNVGDSRCYVVNDHNKVMQITVDHSMIQKMVDQGSLTEQQAKNHPKRHVLLSALGVVASLHADFYALPTRYIKRLLLCSDGLYDMVEEQALRDVLIHVAHSDIAANHLLSAALSAGGEDNISCIVVDF